MNRTVKIGNLKVGGKNPVRIKGMIKSDARKPQRVIAEAKRLEEEGVEAIRIAVKEKQDLKLLSRLKQHVSLPLVADIHFSPELALHSIESGFDGIRINPLNITKEGQIREIARAAKKHKVSIRVGINSGGFKRNFKSPHSLAQAMVRKAEGCLKMLEKENFFDIMVSLKGSDIASTVIANRLFAKKFSYPLHLGITASGPFLEGIIKSSVGLGILLSEGIGDVIRVSLTAPSFWEIRGAKYILQSLDLRKFGPQIVSCPTCSRCEVDLINIVDRFKKEIGKAGFSKPLKIALMGCVVNGPGEAYQADIGIAFGKKKGAIFRKDKILGWTNEKNSVSDLLKEIDRIWTKN
ncbi:MAG: flavodoxin-dependent (E)-4-hydroxy-3-methylbut-2-enyl-diphosphate synthase [Candidatus Omnitrophota bacterium]|nr:MAG: flavodoxin-dependent (E)-4-hydroxy-3-methylbut-2-enyl-diphosphate synthase [Candidatus Omnitrophota bacterium]